MLWRWYFENDSLKSTCIPILLATAMMASRCFRFFIWEGDNKIYFIGWFWELDAAKLVKCFALRPIHSNVQWILWNVRVGLLASPPLSFNEDCAFPHSLSLQISPSCLFCLVTVHLFFRTHIKYSPLLFRRPVDLSPVNHIILLYFCYTPQYTYLHGVFQKIFKAANYNEKTLK